MAMNLEPWNPWLELERVRAESEQLWNHFLKQLRPEEDSEHESIAFLPDVDFVETGNDYRIYISAPGLVEEDIDIVVRDQSLTVRGERYPPYDRHRAQDHLAEWRYGYFERHVDLPQHVDVQRLKASYETGVITIIVAKAT
jgi:HSP20 family protein